MLPIKIPGDDSQRLSSPFLINSVMKINHLTERKKKIIRTGYHGTSTKFLSSILKNGLMGNPPKRTYPEPSDTDTSNVTDPGYATFPGGVYLTMKLDKAIEAAGQSLSRFGGRHIVVEVQFVDGSHELDEDEVTAAFFDSLSALIDQLNPKPYMNVRNYNVLFGLSTNNSLRLDLESLFFKKLQKGANLKDNDGKLHDHRKQYIKQLVDYYVDIFIESLDPKIKLYRAKVEYEFINKSRMDPEFVRIISNIMRLFSFKSFSNTNTTLRIGRSVGFKGKTRIVKIFNPYSNQVYYPSTTRLEKDYYMFGRLSNGFVWGAGANPHEAIINSMVAFSQYVIEDGDNLGTNNVDEFQDKMESLWDDEREQCNIYPIDEHTYDAILKGDTDSPMVVKLMAASHLNEQTAQSYSSHELFEFDLMEDTGGWNVMQSTAFKKGFKKHRNDQRVMASLQQLLEFIKNHPREPQISTYPIEFNVHPIKQDKRFAGSLWSHIKGQKIGLLFKIDTTGSSNKLYLIHLGTHQEIGWS